jgi:hypothetical protein
LVARDAATRAALDTLLFRYQQPEEQAWGVDSARGFKFDWWVIGGRFDGWGREVRALMTRQRLRPAPRPIPRFLERNAIWSDDLGRVRFTSSIYPLAVVTLYGDWIEASPLLPSFGKTTVRVRKAKAAWLKKIRTMMHAFPSCLAICVDYHC